VTQRGKYWENGQWIETEPHEIHKPLNYPNIGPRRILSDLPRRIEIIGEHFPSLKRARFWMTFGQQYLTHLRVIQNIGMASIKPILYEGKEIVPLSVPQSGIAQSGRTR